MATRKSKSPGGGSNQENRSRRRRSPTSNLLDSSGRSQRYLEGIGTQFPRNASPMMQQRRDDEHDARIQANPRMNATRESQARVAGTRPAAAKGAGGTPNYLRQPNHIWMPLKQAYRSTMTGDEAHYSEPSCDGSDRFAYNPNPNYQRDERPQASAFSAPNASDNEMVLPSRPRQLPSSAYGVQASPWGQPQAHYLGIPAVDKNQPIFDETGYDQGTAAGTETWYNPGGLDSQFQGNIHDPAIDLQYGMVPNQQPAGFPLGMSPNGDQGSSFEGSSPGNGSQLSGSRYSNRGIAPSNRLYSIPESPSHVAQPQDSFEMLGNPYGHNPGYVPSLYAGASDLSPHWLTENGPMTAKSLNSNDSFGNTQSSSATFLDDPGNSQSSENHGPHVPGNRPIRPKPETGASSSKRVHSATSASSTVDTEPRARRHKRKMTDREKADMKHKKKYKTVCEMHKKNKQKCDHQKDDK